MFSARKLLPALLFTIIFAAAAPALAEDQDDPPAFTQYGHRVSFCAWSGGVLAWAPAIVLECALPPEGPDPNLAALRDQAMAQCQKELRTTPDEVRTAINCSIGFDGEDFSDDQLRQISFTGVVISRLNSHQTRLWRRGSARRGGFPGTTMGLVRRSEDPIHCHAKRASLLSGRVLDRSGAESCGGLRWRYLSRDDLGPLCVGRGPDVLLRAQTGEGARQWRRLY